MYFCDAEYRGVRDSDASGMFLVGMAMHTGVVESYEGTF